MRNCFICDGNSEHYCSWESYNYRQCNGCGLIYVEKLPEKSAMYSAYTGGTLKAFRRKMVAPFRSFSQLSGYNGKMKRSEKFFNIASSYLKLGEKRRMLDIGCNKGFLLAKGIEHNFEPFGVEIVPVLTVQFKRKYKKYAQNIYSDDFSNVQHNFTDKSFDLVTAIDVVEHFQHPLRDFQQVYRILKPGGIFLIQTPHTGSEVALNEKDDWGAFKAFEHYQLFNKENLQMLANQLGFKKVDFHQEVDKGIGNMVAVLEK